MLVILLCILVILESCACVYVLTKDCRKRWAHDGVFPYAPYALTTFVQIQVNNSNFIK